MRSSSAFEWKLCVVDKIVISCNIIANIEVICSAALLNSEETIVFILYMPNNEISSKTIIYYRFELRFVAEH